MATAALTGAPARTRTGFIASRGFDTALFMLPPVIGLLLAEAIGRIPRLFEADYLFGVRVTPVGIMIGAWTSAHLFAVVFRSHVNREVFATHPRRFVLVPIVLFLGFLVSDWLIVTGLALSVFWDVYHSSAQNFGFCRIYDAKLGNDPTKGRRLDFWLCHCFYILPIFVGVNLAPHVNGLNQYLDVGWTLPQELGRSITAAQDVLARVAIAAGSLFLVYYVFAYWRLVRDGYRISPQKICFLLPTALITIYAWATLPIWKAFFIVNFYHALQYFAIVWWNEQRNIKRLFRLESLRTNTDLALIAFVATVGLVGIGYELWGHDYRALRVPAAVAVVIALMHFWYDGFIWSVRKKQV